jgi:hypothetical protein
MPKWSEKWGRMRGPRALKLAKIGDFWLSDRFERIPREANHPLTTGIRGYGDYLGPRCKYQPDGVVVWGARGGGCGTLVGLNRGG